ncbi:Hamartin protein-domain-containing protein [Clohesyomyces aquaticus]|uniref:Hamartin protein-domain-containing protein n=1 Tax=Clohesyomyces aquaticus TaxID=1231657 RepID=A0A1Y2A2I9_9PLEO|nr:Hamartin protein-domain-containing protein [Clohesyomyces aquaticus]
MREVVKALTSTFSAPTTPYPLPDELHQTVEAFLDRYHDIEEHDSQRLHEDLLSLYRRHVAGVPEKHGSFLNALRLVRPAITGEARLDEWWGQVLKPTIDGMGYKRHEIEDARAILQSILVFDADADTNGELAWISDHFARKVLACYLARTKVPSSADDVISPEDEFVAHELESVLVAYGRRKPKDLLFLLDDLFVQKAHRLQALNLLSAFVRLQPPHLYLVLETPLIRHLEKCLLIDTSSTVIELALMVLIMFLPHICSSLTSDNRLAKLFLIYSRLLCWDKIATSGEPHGTGVPTERQGEDSSDEDDDTDPQWEQVDQSTDFPDNSAPGLLHYFTFLYGLFPLNFMSFIRKPRKTLKSLGFPAADDFDLDQDLIHRRTEPYRRVHLLHTNMFTTTIEDELSENRWLKSDPADVVTECMDLCVAVSTALADPGPPPTSKLPDLPAAPPPQAVSTDFLLDDDATTANDSGASWRNTQSTMFASSNNGQPDTMDFPTPPTSKSVKSSQSPSPLLKGKDVLDSPTLPPAKDDKKQQPKLGAALAGPQRLPTPSPRLENFAQTLAVGSSSPTHSEFQNQSMASLQREIMLLRNDLNFERYLKLQHLAHIGQLQRKNIKEATAEAETQNLINTNRALKARLAKANELYTQLKKETLISRTQSKKWEGELSSKVRTYREDQKVWHGDEDSLRFELQKTQQDCEHLKKMVEKAEAEQLKAQQRTRALEFELEDYGNVRRDLEAVQEKVMTFEDQSKDLQGLLKDRNELRNDLEIANMRLNSREVERERAIKSYERRIQELESRLQAAEKNSGRPGQLPASVQQMLDSAMAANNAKLQQLKKTHYRLLEQYTELEMKYHELEGERRAEMGRLQEKPSYQDLEKQSLNRNFSLRQANANAYGSKYLPPITAEPQLEEYDYYNDYQSPISTTSPSSNYPARPVRLESLPSQKSARDQANFSHGQDLSAAYETSLNAQFQAQNAADVVASSGKSTYSVSTNSSGGGDKPKVTPKSEVRMYGRGGAQNIGKKVKEKEAKQQKEKSNKTGGFRGLKGIM